MFEISSFNTARQWQEGTASKWTQIVLEKYTGCAYLLCVVAFDVKMKTSRFLR